MKSPAAEFAPLRLSDTATEEEIMSCWEGPADKPVVSVVCHTFNHAPYITDAIDGFLAQRTRFAFEILIHDDASTDATAEIVSCYAKRFPTIVRSILQTENQYSQGNRPPKFTFAEARGEYIALCEGDDYWIDHYKLAKQVLCMEKNVAINFAVHPAIKYDFQDKSTAIIGFHGETESIWPVSEVIEGKKHFAPTASYLMRRSAISDLPEWFFKDSQLPVGDFFLEAILGRKGIAYLPDNMSVYRLGVPGSHSERFHERDSDRILSDFMGWSSGVKRLSQFSEIHQKSIQLKVAAIKQEYAEKFLMQGNFTNFQYACPDARGATSFRRYLLLLFARRNRCTFQIAHRMKRLWSVRYTMFTI